MRTHISDEKTLEEGLSLLRFLRTERASFFVGVYTTLEYMLEHNELPKEERPSPQVCLVPEEEAAEDRKCRRPSITAAARRASSSVPSSLGCSGGDA